MGDRLYRTIHQWSLFWAQEWPIDPPQIGEFKKRRSEFFGQDKLNGKAIFLRFVWSGTTMNSPHFEQ
jgi:hypothetical protein